MNQQTFNHHLTAILKDFNTESVRTTREFEYSTAPTFHQNAGVPEHTSGLESSQANLNELHRQPVTQSATTQQHTSSHSAHKFVGEEYPTEDSFLDNFPGTGYAYRHARALFLHEFVKLYLTETEDKGKSSLVDRLKKNETKVLVSTLFPAHEDDLQQVFHPVRLERGIVGSPLLLWRQAASMEKWQRGIPAIRSYDRSYLGAGEWI